jgi:D-3-phosphoglycerate dehydrogenase
MIRILLTHPPHARQWYGAKALDSLSSLGEVVTREVNRDWELDELLEVASSCDVVVSDRSTPAPAVFFEGAESVVALVRCAMDVRNIDLESASANGVLVTHAGPGFVAAVAEWILGQMVNLARSLPDYLLDYRRGRVPDPVMGRQLSGKVVGIIGFGNIGRYLAPVLKAMGMTILVHDPRVEVPRDLADSVDFLMLLKTSDVIVCLAAHTDATENMIDSQALATMKSGALFINASRGGLVDEEALEHALDSGKLGGVALDVGRDFDNLPSLRLARRPDVVATPHIGGMVPEAIEFQALQTVDQVGKILSGTLPEGALNPEAALRLQKRFPLEKGSAHESGKRK